MKSSPIFFRSDYYYYIFPILFDLPALPSSKKMNCYIFRKGNKILFFFVKLLQCKIWMLTIFYRKKTTTTSKKVVSPLNHCKNETFFFIAIFLHFWRISPAVSFISNKGRPISNQAYVNKLCPSLPSLPKKICLPRQHYD